MSDFRCSLGYLLLSTHFKCGMAVLNSSGEEREWPQKRIAEILKLVEFLNQEVKEVSKRLSRVTPRGDRKIRNSGPAQGEDPSPPG